MNTILIRSWIAQNDPNGLAKLAGTSEVSVGTINKILNEGHEPSLPIVRRLAKTIGVSLDELSDFSEEAKATG